MPRPRSAVIEYRNYYLPMHFPVLLLSGDHWRISNVPSGRLHFHNCLEIGICHSDSGILEICGESLPFKAGDITVIPQNAPHTTYSSPGTESHWSYLFIDPKELFKNILPALWKNIDMTIDGFRGYRHIFNQNEHPQIYFLVTSIIRELEEKNPCYQINAKGLLISLYIELYRIQNSLENMNPSTDNNGNASVKTPDNSLVIAPVLDFIEENYMQQFTIETLASLCHWSPTHFRRVFHSIMGTMPLDYVNSTRVSKACNLLRSTESSILEISEMVGFHSISSFNRYFVKLMQMSPRKYRKHMQQLDKRTEKQSILEYAGWMYPEK